jgi:hypothetical protein
MAAGEFVTTRNLASFYATATGARASVIAEGPPEGTHMRKILVLLFGLLLALLADVQSSRAQFIECDHEYVASFEVREADGDLVWSPGTIECVEYFRFSFATPNGTRWIRGIGDVNVSTMLAPGAVAAVENGARRAAQRFAALGDYSIENTTILMAFATAESLANEPASGRTAAWTIGADGSSPAFAECHVTMFLLNDYSTDVEIPHAVSHELFHCVETASLTPAQMATWTAHGQWWVDGAAELFAAAVVGNDNVRWDRAAQFRQAVEDETPIYDLSYSSAVLFWWMYDRYGLGALMPMLREAPEDGSVAAQRRFLREAFDEGEWLEFIKAYLNRSIPYPGASGSRLGEAPDGQTWAIDANITHERDLEPFVISLGWAEYGCGVWGNSVNEANAEARQSEAWAHWPTETDARGGGRVRYRVAAIHTGDEPSALRLRVERRASCDACLTRTTIDRCVVGSWRLTGGGPGEWLRSQGVPFTRLNVSEFTLTMNEDGTFTTSSFNSDFRTESGDMAGSGAGATQATTGRWAAEEGRLYGCTDSGGESSGSVTVESPRGSGTAPYSRGSLFGTSGSSTYSCNATTFHTEHPMERGGPMTHTFTRLTPPPPAD